MKKHIALGLVASTLFLAGCCTAHKTAHWEYKTETLSVAAALNAGTLNAYAKDGWEFVSATPVSNDPNLGSVVVFKRRAQILSGCAHDHPEAPSKIASKPATAPTATFNVSATGGAPVSYQWHKNSTNTPAVTGNPDGSWELYLDGTNNPSK